MKSAFDSAQHVVLHGQSGTGKSWLYKKFLAGIGAHYEVANLANASRLGSIQAELTNVVDRQGMPIKTEYSERKEGHVTAVISSGSLAHEDKYELRSKEPVERCFEFMRKMAGSRPAVLVLDNLENVFSSKQILKELADIITLCDDERYASYRVRLLIVGVPADLKSYYYKTPHFQTVANRIRELPEVSRLTEEECDALVKRGFVELLQFRIDQESNFLKHVRWVTLRIPQMVHEYCLEAANLALSTRQVDPSIWKRADEAWASAKLVSSYSVIESHMNERNTIAGRRNQVLYALSKCDEDEIRFTHVEDVLRREFPKNTSEVTLNVNQILSQLAKSEGDDAMPLLKKSAKEDGYTFVDPRHRMVLRAMLLKTDDEKVERKPLPAAI